MDCASERESGQNNERAPGQTALIWAIAGGGAATVRLLLAHGADPNLADDWGQTPLVWAAREGNGAAAKLLIAAGAEIDRADDIGCTPVLAAAQGGRALLVKLLRRAGANVRRTMLAELGGLTLLHLAALSGDDETLIASARADRLDVVDSQQVTALTAAIAEMKFGTARRLIALGADVNGRGASDAATPLWAACWLREADASLEMVEELLAAGADPGLPGLFQEPPLQRAVSKGYATVAGRLIDAGADVLATDRFGMTLLMAAARSDRLALLQVLLAEGLDVNARQHDGMTALMYARKPEVVRFLVDAGAEINAQTDTGETALMFRDDDELEAVRSLLQLGADPTLQNSCGMAAADFARHRKRPKLAQLLEARE